MAVQRADTIEDCVERIRSAWDGGNAAAFAAEFTEDATYVVYFGMPLTGRAEIERMHVDPLGRGTRMRIKVLSTKFLTDDVAVVLTVGGVGKETTIPYDKVQTLTLGSADQSMEMHCFPKNRDYFSCETSLSGHRTLMKGLSVVAKE
jgi:uncharacterized protein (TIGR02246 family)